MRAFGVLPHCSRQAYDHQKNSHKICYKRYTCQSLILYHLLSTASLNRPSDTISLVLLDCYYPSMETDGSHDARNATRNPRAKQETGRTPKLRASCDHCANAKVRCGQDRPSCQRCLYLNVPCNYSASRRMGRTSKSGRSGDSKTRTKTSARKNSKAESCCTDTTSESSDSPKYTMQRLSDAGLGPYGQDFDYVASQPWNDVNFMSDLSGSPNYGSFSEIQANASHLAQPQLTSPQLQATPSNVNQLSFAAPFQNNANPDSNSIRMGAGHSIFQQLPPDLLTSPNRIPNQASSIAHQSTSCVELASSTIHSLSLPSSMCTSSHHPIPFHSVEQVLATSRAAISAFNKILQCQCSQSTSFTLTLALIISKIIDCHSAICRLPTSSPATTIAHSRKAPPSIMDFPTPSSSASSSTALSPIGSSSTSMSQGGPHNIVMDTPIAIGGYNIDPDDEHVFILQLVLSEIRKVSKLVDAFAVQCSTAVALNGRSSCGEDTVYKSLEHFLRCQVHKARREVDAILRRSEEGA